jgi:hypothetical protein
MNFDIMNFLMDLKQTDFKTNIKMKIQEGVSKDKSKRRIVRERKDFVILSESELNDILNSQINIKKSLEYKEYLNNFEDLDFYDVDCYDKISISFPILEDKQNEKEYGQINISLIESEYDFVVDMNFNFFSLEENMTTEDIKYFFNTTLVNLIKLFANNGIDKKALSYLNERVISSFFKEDIDFCLFDEYKESKKLDMIDFYIVSLMSNANETKKNKDLLKELESDEHRELFDNSKEFIEEIISITNPSNIKELVENLELRFGK